MPRTQIVVRCTPEEKSSVQDVAELYAGGNMSKLVLGVTLGDGVEALTVALKDPTLAHQLFNHCEQFSLDWRQLVREAITDAMRRSI